MRRAYADEDAYQDYDGDYGDDYRPPARLRAWYDDDGRPAPLTQRTPHKRTFTEIGGPAWDWDQRFEDPSIAPPDPYLAAKRARYAWAEDYEHESDDDDLDKYGPYLQPPCSPARRVAGEKRRAEAVVNSDE